MADNSYAWSDDDDDIVTAAVEQTEWDYAFNNATASLNEAFDLDETSLIEYYEEMGRISSSATVLKDIPMNTISSTALEDVVNGRCVQSGSSSDIDTTTISDDRSFTSVAANYNVNQLPSTSAATNYTDNQVPSTSAATNYYDNHRTSTSVAANYNVNQRPSTSADANYNVNQIGSGGSVIHRGQLFTVLRKSERYYQKLHTQGVYYSLEIPPPDAKMNPEDWLTDLIIGIINYFLSTNKIEIRPGDRVGMSLRNSSCGTEPVYISLRRSDQLSAE